MLVSAGGEVDSKVVSSVEKYLTKANMWRGLPPLENPRSYAIGVVL